MGTADLLTEASALWATSREGYRDGLIGVGRLLQRYVLARVTAGDGLNECERRKVGASRERATAEAATALGVGRLKVAELIRVAAVADLLAPISGFGALSYSCLRSMRVFVHRPGRGKKVSRVKAGADGHRPASAMEVWAVRPGFAESAPGVVARAVAGAWRDADVRRELARKGGPVAPKLGVKPCGTTPPKEGVFTTGRVAKICKVAPRTVSKWVDSGRLKGYRIPGSLDRRVPQADLLAFLRRFGVPVPSELDPPAGSRLALWAADPPDGFTVVDQFEFGAAVASGPVETALIGDEYGASVAVRAARFLRARHGGARIVLALSDDAGEIDPAGMAGVEIHRGPVSWFSLGFGAQLKQGA